MAITGPTLIDLVESTVSASTIVLTVPVGGVPADAMIFVDVNTQLTLGTTPTSVADDGGNTYANTRPTTDDSNRFLAFVTTALVQNDQITVTLNQAADRRVAIAYYFEGLADASPKVNNFTTDETAPSGTFAAGDLALGRVRVGGNNAAYTEDANYSTINSPAPSLEVGTTPRITSNSAHQIVSTGGAISYDPTVTNFAGTLSLHLTGHAPAGEGGLPLFNHYYQ